MTEAGAGPVTAGPEGAERVITTSVSESLAHGLALRLTRSAQERRRALEARAKVTPIRKRAAAFRNAMRHLRAIIPPDLRAWEYVGGDGSGKDKGERYVVCHWDRADDWAGTPEARAAAQRQLALVGTRVDARHVDEWTTLLCVVTEHALMRLFYRLRTTSEAPVLEELRHLAYGVVEHFELLAAMGPKAEVLLPSPAGAFVIAVDRHDPDNRIVKTWMDDRRMESASARLPAVMAARVELGLVLNFPGAYPVLSEQRVRDLGPEAPDRPPHVALNMLCDRALDLPADWRFRAVDESAPAPAR